MAGGLLAAIETLSAVDFALLGSASLVTGAVAAVGAALSRPDMVESLASLIATLQTLWLVFPHIRRNDQDPAAAAAVRLRTASQIQTISRGAVDLLFLVILVVDSYVSRLGFGCRICRGRLTPPRKTGIQVPSIC